MGFGRVYSRGCPWESRESQLRASRGSELRVSRPRLWFQASGGSYFLRLMLDSGSGGKGISYFLRLLDSDSGGVGGLESSDITGSGSVGGGVGALGRVGEGSLEICCGGGEASRLLGEADEAREVVELFWSWSKKIGAWIQGLIEILIPVSQPNSGKGELSLLSGLVLEGSWFI